MWIWKTGSTASAKALGWESISAHIGYAVLQGSEWPGWCKSFTDEVRLEGIFKLDSPSDLRPRERENDTVIGSCSDSQIL